MDWAQSLRAYASVPQNTVGCGPGGMDPVHHGPHPKTIWSWRGRLDGEPRLCLFVPPKKAKS